MTTNEGARPVVVGVDGSPSSDHALDWAVAESSRRGLPLRVVHARGIPFGDPRLLAAYTDPDPGLSSVARSALARVVSLAPDVDVEAVSPATTPARALLEHAHGADTLVVGARGHRILPASLLGSTSTQVSTHARCPVVVVRAPAPPPGRSPHVVVGVDGSTSSADAIEYAFEEASSRGALLTAVHASWFLVSEWGSPSSGMTDLEAAVRERERQLAADSLTPARERHPDVEVREVGVAAHPVEALASASDGADLLVVGSRGRGGFTGLLLGSVGQGLLHSSHCPVAIVHPRARGRQDPLRAESGAASAG